MCYLECHTEKVEGQGYFIRGSDRTTKEDAGVPLLQMDQYRVASFLPRMKFGVSLPVLDKPVLAILKTFL